MGERFGLGDHSKFTMLSGIAHDPIQRDSECFYVLLAYFIEEMSIAISVYTSVLRRPAACSHS
jgi:L-aminoadipate-semialdehyde dehydrogenase